MMKNLLNPSLWQYSSPWGNVIEPNTHRQISVDPSLVIWGQEDVSFLVGRGPTQGWYMDKDWIRQETVSKYAIGCCYAKDEARTHFGTYKFRFKLPNFRGAWPAIWAIDFHDTPAKGGDGMGIPPEQDFFEHFRKDSILSAFHITMTYHDGPTYEDDKTLQSVYRSFLPIHWRPINLEYIWNPDYISWTVNGKKKIQVNRIDYPNFPLLPMNLIMGAGLGIDWRPKFQNAKPFIITKAEYYPFLKS